MSIRKLLATVLALALMTISPAMAASISVVTNAKTDVYTLAADSADTITVPKGLNVRLKETLGDWGRITYKGHTAFIPLKYIDLKKPVKAYLSKSVTLYSGAGTGGIAPMTSGTAVYFLGVDGDYARVTNRAHSFVGYVAKDALTTSRTSVLSDSSDDALIEFAIRTAQSLMGRPYALLADPPHSFNCAAFVEYCYNHAHSGSVKKSLTGQVNDSRYAKIGSISQLKRGDMVCFNAEADSSHIGHVGIYLGSGYFIHASATEKGVTVSSLKSGYYKRSFSWGRRIFG